MKIFGLFFLLLTCISQAKTLDYVMCKNRDIVRTIRIEWSEDQEKCLTKYTKAGVDRVVGTGVNTESCKAFLDNVKGNLEEASWRCRDISSNAIIKDLSKF